MGKLKIISDGTVEGTKAFDSETGKEIINIRRIKLSMDRADGTIFLNMFASDVEFEIDQEKETTVQLIMPAEKVSKEVLYENPAIDITPVEEPK